MLHLRIKVPILGFRLRQRRTSCSFGSPLQNFGVAVLGADSVGLGSCSAFLNVASLD